MLRKTLIAGALLILAGALAALWWRIDGNRMPDFDFPEPPSIPEPNAFDLLVDAAEGVPDDGAAISEAVTGKRDPETGEWQEPTLDQIRPVVDEHQEALALARDGLQHPFHYPDLHRVLMGEGEYHFGDFRMLARLMTLEAKVHLADEEFGRAMESVLDCLELGRKIGARSPFIGALTGIAIHGIALGRSPQIISGLNADELLDSIDRMEALRKIRLDMADILRAERRHSFNNLKSVFTKPDWRLRLAESEQMYIDDSWFGEADFTYWQRVQVRLRTWKYHKGSIVGAFEDMTSAVSEVLDRPFFEREGRFPNPGRTLPPSLGESFIESVPGTWFVVLLNQTTYEMLLATLAIEAWRKDTGEYPEELEDLTTELLQTRPHDPFTTGDPLRYRRQNDSYVLYSVGPNGNDDGGHPMENPDSESELRYRPHAELSGDLVAGFNVLRPPEP